MPQLERILIVDDDLPTRAFLTEVLQEEGYTVQTAANGHSALERMQECPPDMLLLDLLLPIMDGYAVLEQVRRMEGCAPIVVLMTADAQRAKRIAAEGHILCLMKPFNLDTLVACLQDAIQQQRSQPPGWRRLERHLGI